MFSIEHQNTICLLKMFKDIIMSGQKCLDIYVVKKYYLWEGLVHPHNTYVQLLAETGLMGLFWINIIFIYLSKIIKHFFINL